MFFNDLNIYDTFISMIWSSAGGTGMNFLLVYAVFKNVSKTYMEAAEIDGASDFTVFIKIMLRKFQTQYKRKVIRLLGMKRLLQN